MKPHGFLIDDRDLTHDPEKVAKQAGSEATITGPQDVRPRTRDTAMRMPSALPAIETELASPREERAEGLGWVTPVDKALKVAALATADFAAMATAAEGVRKGAEAIVEGSMGLARDVRALAIDKAAEGRRRRPGGTGRRSRRALAPLRRRPLRPRPRASAQEGRP